MSRSRVVMKFGGTSVGTPEAMLRTARHIAREKRTPIVVVSALGGVTNLLLEAVHKAKDGNDYKKLFDVIIERHQSVIEENKLDQHELLDSLRKELSRILQGVEMLGELSPRIKDQLLSLGERMSVRLLAATLRTLGLSAKAWKSWELGLRTSTEYNNARLLDDCIPEIRDALKVTDPNEIPVVTGFIGRSVDGEITTLGRGGSDFSAAIFGVAAEVEEIQIWTDVPGFLRADPRLVPSAEVISAMHFEEAAELAFFGAKVLHPRTIEPARRAGIPVRVLGTFEVDPERIKGIEHFGTLIGKEAPKEPLRALALRSGVHSLTIHSLRMLEAHGFLARIFDILARHEISVDVIATSEVSISMTFDCGGEKLEPAIEELSVFAEVIKAPTRSILCLVGEGLRSESSLLPNIFSILSDAKLPIHVISQGASRINMTLVCDSEHAPRAMKALHDAFF